MKEYRKLSGEEVARLKAQMCTAADWERIEVSADFSAEHVMYTRFSGNEETFRPIPCNVA